MKKKINRKSKVMGIILGLSVAVIPATAIATSMQVNAATLNPPTPTSSSSTPMAPMLADKKNIGENGANVFAQWDDTKKAVIITGDDKAPMDRQLFEDYKKSHKDYNVVEINSPITLPKNVQKFFICDGKDSIEGAVHIDKGVDTSKVTDMSYMFFGCTNANPEVGNFDTKNVTDMSGMFYGCKVANPDVTKWDTKNVTDMSLMFHGAISANPDVTKWDTSNVVKMNNMFSGAISAIPNVTDWKTTNVKYMTNMFYGAKIADPDVSKWDTKNVVDMFGMFQGCEKADPDVSKWDTSNVVHMSQMFYNCKVANPDVSKWDTSNVIEMNGMFYGCENANPDVTDWKTPKLIDTTNMFYGATKAVPNVSKWDISKLETMVDMFYETPALKESILNNILASLPEYEQKKNEEAVIDAVNKAKEELKSANDINEIKDIKVVLHNEIASVLKTEKDKTKVVDKKEEQKVETTDKTDVKTTKKDIVETGDTNKNLIMSVVMLLGGAIGAGALFKFKKKNS